MGSNVEIGQTSEHCYTEYSGEEKNLRFSSEIKKILHQSQSHLVKLLTGFRNIYFSMLSGSRIFY